jgi:hypothetical protein
MVLTVSLMRLISFGQNIVGSRRRWREIEKFWIEFGFGEGRKFAFALTLVGSGFQKTRSAAQWVMTAEELILAGREVPHGPQQILVA